MSLLLDALKKAAEQKAAKDDETITKTVSTSDVTVVIEKTQTVIDNTLVFEEDQTGYQADETIAIPEPGENLPNHNVETISGGPLAESSLGHTKEDKTEWAEPTKFDGDETLILDDEDVTEFINDDDAIQIVANQENSSQIATDQDKTVQGFKADTTQRDLTESTQLDGQVDSTELNEATHLSDTDDATEKVTNQEDSSQIEPEQDKTVQNYKADSTQLDLTESTQLDGQVDSTEINEATHLSDAGDATQTAANQEDFSQIAPEQDKTVQNYKANSTQLDLTESTQLDDQVDSTETNKATHLSNAGDDSDEILTNDDVTAFLGEHDFPAKRPTYSQSTDVEESETELEATAVDEGRHIEDDGAETEDISLTLMGMDDQTSFQTKVDDSTESQITDAEVQILGQASHSTESLNLVEIPSGSGAGSDTITNRSIALDRLTNEETVARQDSTSTRTYAPDNYDRTLIKVDQDDASKLFAGMKSESDVVMTPDYAKKVFISNSSVQRINHYKIYSGVAAAILLVILILGLFEYEDESENIDNSLRALKRDPTPNLPQRTGIEKRTDLFAQTNSAGAGVDIKTLALVESAGDLSEITPGTADGIADNVEVSGTIKSNEAVTEAAEENSVTVNDSKGNEVAIAEKSAVKQASSDVKTPTKSLQIASKNTIDKKDKLLKDAYAAYQRGDNVTALQKYNLVLATDADNRNALLARAAINVQNDNSVEAIADYQKILIANPKDSLAMSSLITVASISPSKSESQLKGMIRDEPNSPHLNFALANVYGAQNRWQEAQSLYFIALENNPTDPNYAYNLAVSLEHIAKPMVAVTYYQRALTNFNNGLATFNREVVDQRVEILQQL